MKLAQHELICQMTSLFRKRRKKFLSVDSTNSRLELSPKFNIPRVIFTNFTRDSLRPYRA